MSKLIVEMEMPSSCFGCPMSNSYQKNIICSIDNARRKGDFAFRPDWCPIADVLPEQHGRLVDADACSSVLRKLENEAKTNTEKLCYGYAAKMFEEAFTIIAAERKDDEH